MVLIGKKFPGINVKSMSYLGIEKFISVVSEATSNKKKVLLLWYPKDFTNICPTELHAFQEKVIEFEDRNCIIIAASCDSCETHLAWLKIHKNHGGISGVRYPILADTKRDLSSILGILDSEDNVPYRATYLIDEDGIVFYESVNENSIARNVDDYLRILDAKKLVQTKGVACPANWKEGDEGIDVSIYNVDLNFL